MSSLFQTIDKIKPVYDKTYEFVLFLCKMLLTVDILITCMAVAGRYVPFIPDPAWSEEVVLTPVWPIWQCFQPPWRSAGTPISE